MPQSYGLRQSGAGLLTWKHVDERMSRARNYWIGTTRPDGRPHVMPVWGVWVNERFYFGTDQRSRKTRNLAANPALVVHLESGDEVVILEGEAEEVADSSLLAQVDDAYFAKYGVRLIGHPGEVVIYGLRARLAFGWQERDFPGSATRWSFGDG